MPDVSKPLAVFQKDGRTRNAYTPADAVKYRFDGWAEKKTAAGKAAPSRKPATKKPAAKKAGAKAAKSESPAGGADDPSTS